MLHTLAQAVLSRKGEKSPIKDFIVATTLKTKNHQECKIKMKECEPVINKTIVMHN